MRQIVRLLLLTALAVAAWAQHSNGYVFAGPGGLEGTATLQLGIGGEYVWRRIGVGGEIGGLAPASDLSAAVGAFSVNGYGHFGRGKLDPFVTAGYTRFQREGGANAFNYGAGLTYWFKRHLGARIEVRDHVVTESGSLHVWNVRFGLAF